MLYVSLKLNLAAVRIPRQQGRQDDASCHRLQPPACGLHLVTDPACRSSHSYPLLRSPTWRRHRSMRGCADARIVHHVDCVSFAAPRSVREDLGLL